MDFIEQLQSLSAKAEKLSSLSSSKFWKYALFTRLWKQVTVVQIDCFFKNLKGNLSNSAEIQKKLCIFDVGYFKDFQQIAGIY